MVPDGFEKRLLGLQEGTYPVGYRGAKYLVTKRIRLSGRLVKLYAFKLGGNDIISCNYYLGVKGSLLKPCEMPACKVIDFVEHLVTFS